MHTAAVRHPIARIERTRSDLRIDDRLDNDISPTDTVPSHLILLLDVADSSGSSENDSSRLHTFAVRRVHASTVQTKAEGLS